jgi:dienelactone hydrolase/predicted Ser/Thr protein kinase
MSDSLREGATLSHYRIVAHLGGGGMGVVYKAEDTRLRRPVALKFLPPDLTRNEEARQRFEQEAQAASALDHPNICTIYEIDSTDDDRLFIAMAFCDGVTLKKRLQSGPLPMAEAVDVALQIARGLEKAHHAGIIHRDIKPANLMITDGLVKIVDFGIAKLMDRTGPTRTGTTLGTVSYMSPEQVNGDAVDHRTDLWALGVVLYEMLAGRLPFGGDHEAAILNNIVRQTPAPISTLRPDISSDVQAVVARALQKRPEERYASAADMAQDLARCQAQATRSVAGLADTPRRSRRSTAVMTAVALALAAVAAVWAVKRGADSRRLDAAIAEATQLADRDQNAAALARLDAIGSIPAGDARLGSLLERISLPRPIVSTPDGADVYVKDAADVTGAWKHLGRTPLNDVRLPRGGLRWKLDKDGYDSTELIRPNAPGLDLRFTLTQHGSLPPNMIAVDQPQLRLTLTGYDYIRSIAAPKYAIDKYEVTNKQFKEFVDGGGYTKREYWKQPFVDQGRTLSWDEAIARFRDRTGRFGPASWEVGAFPQGQDSLPVNGVSWYEAAAYAEFVGKSLPTVYHWLAAAGIPGAAYITPLSNLAGKGLAPVGTFSAVSAAGAYDMAGNVKEWCWNDIAPGQARYILGGAWNDPKHMFVFADARPPFDRSETNGFRLVKYLGDAPPNPALAASIDAPRRDFSVEKPVSDEVFRVIKDQYAYDQRPLDVKVESVETTEQWTREKVSFTTAYDNERMTAYVFLPKNVQPPYQTIVFAPGAASLTTPNSGDMQTSVFDFVIVSGRALIYPVYKGAHERTIGRTSTWPDLSRAYKDWIVQIVNDARRSVDYLASRKDIDGDRLGYYGISWGAMFGSIVVAQEPRLKAAVFADGGLTPAKKPPEVDQFNFAPRVNVPVLMVNGDNDYIYQVDISQNTLFATLGTAPDRKRHVTMPGGHGIVNQQRSQAVREILDWLDRYLGPVRR